MGMDVYGRKPTAPEGEYFRRNVWGWRPLAMLVRKLAPETTRQCKYWYSNDGDGLRAANAKRLAAILDKALASGRVAALIAIRVARLRRMPDVSCTFCAGTGTRTDDVGEKLGYDKRAIDADDHPRHGATGWCNGCDGRGSTRPSETNYYLRETDVRDFSEFLKVSGGFRIC